MARCSVLLGSEDVCACPHTGANTGRCIVHTPDVGTSCRLVRQLAGGRNGAFDMGVMVHDSQSILWAMHWMYM